MEDKHTPKDEHSWSCTNCGLYYNSPLKATTCCTSSAIINELLSACIRMMVGINKESRPDLKCEYYEGIAQDGADEADVAICKAGHGIK